MKVLTIQHLRNDKVIWEQQDIRNLLHLSGEQFVLQAAFTGGQVNNVIPSHYYLGLDDRSTINPQDNMTSLVGEPVGHGYTRQAISSSGDFTVVFGSINHYQAISPIIAFQAIGGSWGPVQNLFLTNRADNGGALISSVQLAIPVTVQDADSITIRIAMSLRDCP